MKEKKFFDSVGQSDDDVFNAINAKGDTCTQAEMAVNFGYLWFPKYNVWVNKNGEFTPEQENLLEKMREKYGV